MSGHEAMRLTGLHPFACAVPSSEALPISPASLILSPSHLLPPQGPCSRLMLPQKAASLLLAAAVPSVPQPPMPCLQCPMPLVSVSAPEWGLLKAWDCLLPSVLTQILLQTQHSQSTARPWAEPVLFVFYQFRNVPSGEQWGEMEFLVNRAALFLIFWLTEDRLWGLGQTHARCQETWLGILLTPY